VEGSREEGNPQNGSEKRGEKEDTHLEQSHTLIAEALRVLHHLLFRPLLSERSSPTSKLLPSFVLDEVDEVDEAPSPDREGKDMLLVSKVHDLQKRKSEDEEKVRKGERKTHLRLPPFPHHLLVLLDRDQAPPSNPVAIPRPLRLLRQAQLLVHPPSNVRADTVARDENVSFDGFAILELDVDTGRSVGVVGEAFAEDGDAGREELDKLVEKVGAEKGEKVSPSRYIPRRRGSPMHVDISGSLVVALDAASRSGSDEKVKGSGKERRRTSRRRLRAFRESFQRCESRTCNIGSARKRRNG
jgi:hypothetical protein